MMTLLTLSLEFAWKTRDVSTSLDWLPSFIADSVQVTSSTKSCLEFNERHGFFRCFQPSACHVTWRSHRIGRLPAPNRPRLSLEIRSLVKIKCLRLTRMVWCCWCCCHWRRTSYELEWLTVRCVNHAEPDVRPIRRWNWDPSLEPSSAALKRGKTQKVVSLFFRRIVTQRTATIALAASRKRSQVNDTRKRRRRVRLPPSAPINKVDPRQQLWWPAEQKKIKCRWFTSTEYINDHAVECCDKRRYFHVIDKTPLKDFCVEGSTIDAGLVLYLQQNGTTTFSIFSTFSKTRLSLAERQHPRGRPTTFQSRSNMQIFDFWKKKSLTQHARRWIKTKLIEWRKTRKFSRRQDCRMLDLEWRAHARHTPVRCFSHLGLFVPPD